MKKLLAFILVAGFLIFGQANVLLAQDMESDTTEMAQEDSTSMMETTSAAEVEDVADDDLVAETEDLTFHQS